MSSRLNKVSDLKEDLPPTISPSTHPQTVRRTLCIHTGKGRNLVVNLDGTANQFSEHSTNVVELFSRLIKDGDQMVYYDSGIGTYAPPSFKSLSYLKQVIYHAIDTAIAWNFENIVHAAYKWLSENYQPGDRIFLFGFSRGAYQARVIAGMIEKVGLLHKGNDRQIPFAYELYSSVMESTQRKESGDKATGSTDAGTTSKAEAQRLKQEKLCRQFKNSLCHENVKVHFVGAWDTVSSIGVLRGKSLPETVSGMGHPEFANGGLGPRHGDTGDVKEVWFAGSHSDIGGGNTLNEDLKNFGPALRWMTYEAIMYGLRIKAYEGIWEPPQLTESLKGFWNVLELLPFPCLSYADAHSLTSSPHSWAGRMIQPGQRIHQSVLSQKSIAVLNSINPLPGAFPVTTDNDIDTEVPYFPRATLARGLPLKLWSDLHIEHELIEQDPFENAAHALVSLAEACLAIESGDVSFHRFDAAIVTLESFLHDASLVEVPDAGGTLLTALGVAVLHQALATMTLGHKETLVRLLSHTRLVPTTARLPSVSQVYQWGSKIRRYRDDFLSVLQPFACLGYLKEGYNDISSVAFLLQEPGRIIFTSSPDETTSIFIWDRSTQPPNEIAKVRAGYSTISRDGSHITVSHGKDVSIIDTTAQPPSTTKCTDDEDPNDSGNIHSLCFSTDNHTLGTGHRNGWIKLWRREGDQSKVVKRFKGGNDWIHRLAFSRDGSRLAFYVSITSITVCNLADDAVIELEDSGDSWSLAWSPSGDRIVSGTYFGRVKIWSADRGKLTHTFEAHYDTIPCLAFRDDGQVLATGSRDGRIRIWRCDTWEKIWEFDIGEWVWSLAFSPDGKRLVSGGWKGAVHLWDVDMGDKEPVE
ncbi:hypothetical protein ONZ45_g1992 [Pleurotus djamor]|nr:hypothetical protein ONZ45_g1992 [Pleurotus djamor]